MNETERDRWVLGAAGQTPAISAQYDHLSENLGEAYAMAFVDAWREAIGRLKIRRLTTDRPSYPLLAAASSVTSPLIRLLESIRDETLLAEPASAEPTPTRRRCECRDAGGDHRRGSRALPPARRRAIRDAARSIRCCRN